MYSFKKTFVLFLISLFAMPVFAIDVYMIGDSTMANKQADRYPETGWGQALAGFAKESVTIHNHAVNGRSSKSFINEGLWEEVREKLQPGDFLIIQFGHNDQKAHDPSRYADPHGVYRANLIRFAQEARAKGAVPILATSICRRKFNGADKLVDTLGEYPQAMRRVAKEFNVYLIDMQQLTERVINNLGVVNSIPLFLHVKAGQYPKYKRDLQDNTHLSVGGAESFARLFVEQLRRDAHPLSNYFNLETYENY